MITSIVPSAFPVLEPESVSPVGSFNMPRTASATGFWRYSDSRLTFAPTYRSPRLSTVDARSTRGNRDLVPRVVNDPTFGGIIERYRGANRASIGDKLGDLYVGRKVKRRAWY